MGGCENYGPLLDPLNTRCRIILRTQKRTMILTTTPMYTILYRFKMYMDIHMVWLSIQHEVVLELRDIPLSM